MTNQILDINQVLQHLPQRPPFLLIDRVIKYELGRSLTAIKNITINEPFFAGHFPNLPIMPGVLILEALAQAGTVLAFLSSDQQFRDESLFFFAGIDKARFKRVVQPGDQLRLEVEIVKARHDIWKLKCEAYVDEHVVCEAELMSARRSTKSDRS